MIEIYERLRPGEPPTLENAKNLLIARFFDPKRYDLAGVGRYKINKKLHIKNRLFNQRLAETLVDPETGEIIAEAGQMVDRRLLDQIIAQIWRKGSASTNYRIVNGVLDDEQTFRCRRSAYFRRSRTERSSRSFPTAMIDKIGQAHYACGYYCLDQLFH